MEPRPDITLAILVGGRGERLGGRAKGNLKLEGQTLLERLLRLAPLVREAILVGDDRGAYPGFSGRRVPDVVAGRGAPGGVASALGAASTAWVLVVPCDMPNVDARVLQALAARTGPGVDAVCLARDGARPQPFPALYRAELAQPFRAALAGEPSMGRLLEPLRVARVDLGAADTLRATGNVNTPEELERWGVTAGDEGGGSGGAM